VSAGLPNFNVGGLASGLDTNTIVSQLMAIERNPQVLLHQRQLVEEARQRVLRDIQTRVQNLQSAISGIGDAAAWADVQTVESSDQTKLVGARTGGAAPGAYTFTISQLARAAQATQQTAATTASATGTLTFKVGAGSVVSVDVTSGDSLETIATRINGTTDIPVYATVVDGGKLVISGKTTGAANAITVGGTLAADFGFTETMAAQDAKYTLNGGAEQSSASNTVTGAVVGVSVTLKSTTTSPVSIVVGAPAPDAEAIQKKIQDLVEQYNSTIDFVHDKLTEKKVANADNDTDRAKGALRGDGQLEGLLRSLRAAFSDLVQGRPSDMQTLSQVGLSTGKTTGSGALDQGAIQGKLTLDTAKLAEKLNGRLSDVKALFTNVTGAYSSEGLAQRLHGVVDPWVVGSGTAAAIFSSRISSEQTMIDSLKKQQSDMDVRLTARETALRQKFTAMETALSQLQSQGNWLLGQLAQLQQ
jgi:flagellar hook-associated protein 2